jgi:two-component system chemotaxis sensor kinase CheA
MNNMSQYKELFVETGKKYLKTLNESLLVLEKDPKNEAVVAEIFRAAHSLKGQSAAMGYEQTGYLCHVVEDVFFEIKEKRLEIDSNVADLLFDALDELSSSVASIEANGSESISDSTAEKLKQATNLQTEGAGKSKRADDGVIEPSLAEAEKVVENKTVASTPSEKVEADHPADISSDIMSAPDSADNADASASPIKIRSISVKVDQLDDIAGSLEELMIHRLTIQNIIQVMKIRAVHLDLIFGHFPRAVRDLGRALKKDIDLQLIGGDIELDRTIVERLDEVLTHLIRNAADHGIDKKGTITISARREPGYAVVSVSDDGKGIDWIAVAKKAGVDASDTVALRKALFSGVSTASAVSLVSGRGVGLEVVDKTIEDFGGSVDVLSTEGNGTTFALRLPLSISIAKTLIVKVGSERYAIMAAAVETSLNLSNITIIKTAGQTAFRYKEKEIPLISMHEEFGHGDQHGKSDSHYAVIINIDGEQVAFAVDEISENLESVIKPMPPILKDVIGFAGVTLVGDGHSVLVLNPRDYI